MLGLMTGSLYEICKTFLFVTHTLYIILRTCITYFVYVHEVSGDEFIVIFMPRSFLKKFQYLNSTCVHVLWIQFIVFCFGVYISKETFKAIRHIIPTIQCFSI